MTSEQAGTAAGRILVGVDGSETSKQALRWAARMIPVVGTHLEAIMVWDYPKSYGWTLAIPEDWRPDLDAEKVLQATIDEVFGADRPPGLVAVVRQGNPGTVLLEAARGAAMMIVGSRGHGGFAGLLLGSVSMACAEHAPCPVLVIHPDRAPSRT